jgi:hypothetical protein
MSKEDPHPLAVRWDTEHEDKDVKRLLEAYAHDFAIYLDRNGWEIRMKPACRPEPDEYDDPEQGWEYLWPMYRQTTATPLWATDECGDMWGPKRTIAYKPNPDDEPPESRR